MCVCVCFVLFCSVVVVLSVVGRQQHRRYIVIDAMVYPRNWILEDELSAGKTLGVFGLSLVFQRLAFATEKIFEFGSYDVMHESNKMSFGRYFIVYLAFLEVRVLLWMSFEHGYDLEREHFFADI